MEMRRLKKERMRHEIELETVLRTQIDLLGFHSRCDGHVMTKMKNGNMEGNHTYLELIIVYIRSDLNCYLNNHDFDFEKTHQ